MMCRDTESLGCDSTNTSSSSSGVPAARPPQVSIETTKVPSFVLNLIRSMMFILVFEESSDPSTILLIDMSSQAPPSSLGVENILIDAVKFSGGAIGEVFSLLFGSSAEVGALSDLCVFILPQCAVIPTDGWRRALANQQQQNSTGVRRYYSCQLYAYRKCAGKGGAGPSTCNQIHIHSLVLDKLRAFPSYPPPKQFVVRSVKAQLCPAFINLLRHFVHSRRAHKPCDIQFLEFPVSDVKRTSGLLLYNAAYGTWLQQPCTDLLYDWNNSARRNSPPPSPPPMLERTVAAAAAQVINRGLSISGLPALAPFNAPDVKLCFAFATTGHCMLGEQCPSIHVSLCSAHIKDPTIQAALHDIHSRTSSVSNEGGVVAHIQGGPHPLCPPQYPQERAPFQAHTTTTTITQSQRERRTQSPASLGAFLHHGTTTTTTSKRTSPNQLDPLRHPMTIPSPSVVFQQSYAAVPPYVVVVQPSVGMPSQEFQAPQESPVPVFQRRIIPGVCQELHFKEEEDLQHRANSWQELDDAIHSATGSARNKNCGGSPTARPHT